MQIEVNAQSRKIQGSSASRRLRKTGKVPGILYGVSKDAQLIELDHNDLYYKLKQEAFHASILNLNLDGQKQQVLLRSFHMHPFKQEIQHIDFQRISKDTKIHMKVPLHFINAQISPAVKESSGIISHVMNEIEVSCLPDDLPEFIEVDLSHLAIGHAIHASDLKVGKGVTLKLQKGDNPVVAVAQIPKELVIEEEAPAAVAAEGTVPVEGAEAAAAAPVKPGEKPAAAPAPAKPAAKTEEKKK